jgi:hypothetical protein
MQVSSQGGAVMDELIVHPNRKMTITGVQYSVPARSVLGDHYKTAGRESFVDHCEQNNKSHIKWDSLLDRTRRT